MNFPRFVLCSSHVFSSVSLFVRFDRIDSQSMVLPRKSTEASITRSKADRDSSSCDATRERIALSASDAEIHRFADTRWEGTSATTADDGDGVRNVGRLARLRNRFANFSFARVISESWIRKLPSRRPKTKKERETNVGGGGSQLCAAWRRTGKMAARWKTRGWSFGGVSRSV